jgi:hypothetical protein
MKEMFKTLQKSFTHASGAPWLCWRAGPVDWKALATTIFLVNLQNLSPGMLEILETPKSFWTQTPLHLLLQCPLLDGLRHDFFAEL